jgi:hypothetical protein
MTGTADLHVEVDGLDIVVTMPGTKHRVTFQKPADGRQLIPKQGFSFLLRIQRMRFSEGTGLLQPGRTQIYDNLAMVVCTENLRGRARCQPQTLAHSHPPQPRGLVRIRWESNLSAKC